MNKPLIEVQGLRKSYGRREVLHDIAFEVYAGEIFGVLGLNGMGKTSTVEILQGLRDRDAGRVLVAGVDPARARHALRSIVGAQLQSCALPDRLRVDEALRLFARLAGDVVDWHALRDQWGLAELARTPFGALSGGEQQRLFIALALVNEPQVVFLDELTQSLDPAARRDTWRLVEQVRDNGATVVLVTHDMEEATRLCDRVALLHHGRITAIDTPSALVAKFGGPVRTEFSAPPAALAGLTALPGVWKADHDGRVARVVGDATSVVLVASELARRGLSPADFTVIRPALDDVFVTLTGASENAVADEATAVAS